MNSAIETNSPPESHLAPVVRVIEQGSVTEDVMVLCLEILDFSEKCWPSQKARYSQLRQALESL